MKRLVSRVWQRLRTMAEEIGNPILLAFVAVMAATSLVVGPLWSYQGHVAAGESASLGRQNQQILQAHGKDETKIQQLEREIKALEEQFNSGVRTVDLAGEHLLENQAAICAVTPGCSLPFPP